MCEKIKRVVEINRLKDKLDGRELFVKLVNEYDEEVNFDNGNKMKLIYVYQPSLFKSSLQINMFDENNNILSMKHEEDVFENCELTIKTGKMINNKISYFNKIQILTDDDEVIFEKCFESELVKEGKSVTITYII